MDYKEIISGYSALPGGIIEAFHALNDKLGYIPESAIIEAAELFGISVSEAYGTASFYSMFSLKPRGKNIIRICQSVPCYTAGTEDLVSALKNNLDIEMDEITVDGQFTLEYTECIGQCQSTPAITINGMPCTGVKSDDIPAILKKYRNH